MTRRGREGVNQRRRHARAVPATGAAAAAVVALLPVFFGGCRLLPKPSGPPPPGTFAPRAGDEIMVCGQLVHTGTPIVLWTDPGGYDAYRVERRFAPFEQSSWEASAAGLDTPNRYGLRAAADLTPEQRERVRGGGWDLRLLQETVDQFVIHYDVCGVSQKCFEVLHDRRCLSVHFMLDIDGTIYQTLDLKERAWHAGAANSRSVGIEIANIGAYPAGKPAPALERWYGPDASGRTAVTVPPELGDGGVRTPDFTGYPDRPDPVVGEVQGRRLQQYDFTPEQYRALAHLTAALCTVFPNLPPDYPRDASGAVVNRILDPGALARHRGLIGHYHLTTRKIDPGPAFQWERVVREARGLMGQ